MKTLEQFLRTQRVDDKRLYQRFCNAIINLRSGNETLAEYFKRNKYKTDAIWCAFSWYYTTEGWDFWEKVSIRWMEICKLNNLKP